MADLHPAMAGIVEPDYQVLANAIYRAEGGPKARKPYGILSVPVKDEAEARQVAINTARNNYQRWIKAGKPGAYVDFLANRYTPPTADPKGNERWRSNVPAIYAQLLAQQAQQAQPTNAVVVPPGYAVTNLPAYRR